MQKRGRAGRNRLSPGSVHAQSGRQFHWGLFQAGGELIVDGAVGCRRQRLAFAPQGDLPVQGTGVSIQILMGGFGEVELKGSFRISGERDFRVRTAIIQNLVKPVGIM